MANKSILVVGGGISGLTAALEAAEAGCEVYIVEKNPYLGGRVTQINQYFPKLCPPNCGLEINFQRIRNNPRINFFTMAEVENISGQEGDFSVTVKLNPRYVNENCTGCGKCVDACPAEIDNPFNYGMNKIKAIHLPHDFAFPMRYVINADACKEAGCAGKCAEVCEYKAIEPDMQPKTMNLNVGAIVWATGWEPYDANKLSYYGYGRYKDVITNVIMERMAAMDGPTSGKIVRPSGGKEINSIAFVQCAGSRDENHLKACSSVCCLATLKHATYVREQYPEAQIDIYYIDIRARGKNEDFFTRVQEAAGINLIKGKAGEIEADSDTGQLVVIAEDQDTLQVARKSYDLVVLATGMEPSTATAPIPTDMAYDEDGFVVPGAGTAGIVATGCVKNPLDVAAAVRDATAAALKAIQSTVRGQ